jgi:hypothetical protein
VAFPLDNTPVGAYPDEQRVGVLARPEAVAAFPVVFDPIVPGISEAAKDLKAGVDAPPDVGPAYTVFALSLAAVTANVPAVVTGLPPTENSAGIVRATLVTVPAPAAAVHPVALKLESTPLA